MELQKFIKNFSDQFEESDVININENADFKLLDTWDSLTSMSVQVMIEDEYQVKVTPNDFKDISSVFLFNLVNSRLPQ